MGMFWVPDRPFGISTFFSPYSSLEYPLKAQKRCFQPKNVPLWSIMSLVGRVWGRLYLRKNPNLPLETILNIFMTIRKNGLFYILHFTEGRSKVVLSKIPSHEIS